MVAALAWAAPAARCTATTASERTLGLPWRASSAPMSATSAAARATFSGKLTIPPNAERKIRSLSAALRPRAARNAATYSRYTCASLSM